MSGITSVKRKACNKNSFFAGTSPRSERSRDSKKTPQNHPQNSLHFDHKKGAQLDIKARNSASGVSRGIAAYVKDERLFEKIDPETGEIVTIQMTKNGDRIYKNSSLLRSERFALKSVVNLLFSSSSTAKCCRAKIPAQKVKVMKDDEHKRAFYAGLRQCASVWLCPVCASKIAERRRAELVAATATAKAMDMQVFLMTLTIPHGLGDDINAMLQKMLKSWNSMQNDRAGKQMKKLLGVVGYIRAFEVTDGPNGFHPHFHVLLFVKGDSKYDSSLFECAFYYLWRSSCIKAGLPEPSQRAFKVDDGSFAEKYVTKWGLESEMTRGHMKESKGYKGMTPFDLLRDAFYNDSERSRARFVIYANAFKGKRQLHWSVGLKSLLSVKTATDEELCAIQEQNAYELAELTTDQWRAVLKTRSEAALLEVAEHSPDQIQNFLQSLSEVSYAL